jgi:hypothetical protein
MSLYSEKIEALIDAALADGVLTEKEKQILFKKAQAEGIDLDEFEMVLDARLVELQKKSKEETKKSAPKSDKFGDVRKCPACGALVPAMAAVCPECGYEFSGVQASSSAQLLAKQISELQNEGMSQKTRIIENTNEKNLFDTTSFDRQRDIDEGTTKKIVSLIENYPIPNTKADVLDFLTALKPKVETKSDDNTYELRKAYFIKYQECLEKARILFPNDSRINYFIETLPKLKKIIKRANPSYLIKWIIGGVWGAIILAVVIGVLVDGGF